MKRIISLILGIILAVTVLTALAVSAFAGAAQAETTCDAVLKGFQNQVNGTGVRLVAEISHIENYREIGFELTRDETTVTRSVTSVFSTLIAADDSGDTYEALTAEDGKYLYALAISDIPEDAVLLTVSPYTVDTEGNKVTGESRVIGKPANGSFLTTPVLTLTDESRIDANLGSEAILPTAAATASDGTDLTASVQVSGSEGLTIADGKATAAVAGVYTVTYAVSDPRVPALSTTKAVTVSFVQNGVAVSGTLKSATYEVGGKAYDLYALDYSKATVILTDGTTQYAATISEDGTYSVTVPAGTYTVRYTYPNFVCNDTTVTVDNSGLTAETAANANLVVKIPVVADSTTVGGSTVTAGKTGIFDYTDAANHTLTIPKGYDDDAYLVGTEGNVVLFEAIIRNAQSNGTGTATRYQMGLIISAFMNGTAKTRDAILLDQTNAAGAYTGNLVRPWLNNNWNNTNLVGDLANVANMTEDTGVKLTIVRVETVMYVFLDDQFVSLVTGLQTSAGALGFQTLSKTGGTYSNYVYSYNSELIQAKIASAVEVPASVDNATLTADKTTGVKLGDTVTFTLTPEEGYTVDTFLVNGKDCTADLTLTDGVYTLAYKVMDATVTVQATTKLSE